MFEVKDESPLKQRRLKMFYVPVKELARIVTTGEDCPYVQYCSEGLPPGADVVGVMYSHEKMCFTVIVCHKDFDSVPEGENIPTIGIEFKRREKPKFTVVEGAPV